VVRNGGLALGQGSLEVTRAHLFLSGNQREQAQSHRVGRCPGGGYNAVEAELALVRAARALFNPAAPLGLATFTEPFKLYSSEAKFFLAKRIDVYDFLSCSSK
jgi:hypothetical protein